MAIICAGGNFHRYSIMGITSRGHVLMVMCRQFTGQEYTHNIASLTWHGFWQSSSQEVMEGFSCTCARLSMLFQYVVLHGWCSVFTLCTQTTQSLGAVPTSKAKQLLQICKCHQDEGVAIWLGYGNSLGPVVCQPVSIWNLRHVTLGAFHILQPTVYIIPQTPYGRHLTITLLYIKEYTIFWKNIS